MQVLCLHPYLSMRAIKEMAALKQKGHSVILAFEAIGCSAENGFGTFWDGVIKLPSDTFKGEYYCRRLFPGTYKKILTRVLKKIDFDVIHAYSMPDTLAVAAIRYFDIPVVYDSRDVSSGMDELLLEDLKITCLNKIQSYFYRKIIKRFEREANEKSSARVYVSREMKEFVYNAYNISNKNSIVLPNYQSSFFLPRQIIPKMSDKDGSIHIVYVGNILFDDFKRVVELLKRIETNSIHIHLYPIGTKKCINNFKDIFKSNKNIYFHKPLPQADLLEVLQQYDFGLVPRPPDRNAINNGFALPNKLFDYLAAGIPVIARNTDSISKFIKENKVGIIYTDVKDLVSKINNNSNNFQFDNKKFIMESHIHLLEDLYKELCREKS